MRPRGQLWYELQRICQDFREFSGLEKAEALDVMIAVLRNLLADTEEERDKLTGGGTEAPPPT